MPVAKFKQNNPAARDFVNKLDIVAPLNPHDAFCGGRTNAIKLYHQAEADEEIDYYNYTSLYPYVNKNAVYPQKVIQRSSFNQDTPTFGIPQCTVLPPTNSITQCYHSAKTTS